MWMEFEDVTAPPYLSIRDNVNKSDALFVLLSEHLVDKQHTNNWVSFEVGLAANQERPETNGKAMHSPFGLDIYVFEPLDQHIDFAVPYFTHYMRYPTTEAAFKWLRDRLRDGSLARSGFSISCAWEDCKITFDYLSRFYTDSYYCPACRREVIFKKSYKDFKLGQFQKKVTEEVMKELKESD